MDGHGRSGRTTAVAAWLLVAAGVGLPSPGVTAEPPDSLDDRLRQLVPFGFSGGVLVVEGGRRLHAGGYGAADRAIGRRITPSTVFSIGSVSKQFTAAVVLSMEEDGLLSVHDPVGRHLPGVPSDKRSVTLHHLLTHTSGLPAFHDTAGDYQVMTRRQAERSILAAELAFEPGEDWSYSNSGYTLLAAIVERVAGRPFEEVLRERIFEPAGLRRTGLSVEPVWADLPVAHGYTGGRDRGAPTDWSDARELWALIGNGGVLSTLDDLERWHRALREGTVLSPRTVERFFRGREPVRDGLRYGYGWFVEEDGDGGTVVRHGGANDFGFGTRLRWHPERDLLVALFVNRQPPGMDVSLAADAVGGLVESTVLGRPLDGPPAGAEEVAGGELQPYTGRYRLEGGGELSVARSLGSLVVRPHSPESVRLLAFPGASRVELDDARLLDRRAADILDGVAAGDYEPFARVLADSSSLDFYRSYIGDWWREVEAAGAGRDDVEVVGTVPIWWSSGDDRLATVIRSRADRRARYFRLHWRDGRIVALGGGAVRQPATTLFGRTAPGTFVGYHLGIRRPVELSFVEDDRGRVTAVRLETARQVVVARRVER